MTAENLVPGDDPAEVFRMAHHYGPSGPVAAVYVWLDFIKAENFASAWEGMDNNFRLCRAQAWLWMNRTHSDIAALDLEQEAQRLVAVHSRSLLWSDFAATELDQLHESWQRFFDAYEAGTLGAASHLRMVGPDLEIVILVDTGTTDAVVYEGDTLVPDALIFTMRMTEDGWKVAAYDDFIPEPGWPPQFERPVG